MNPEQNSPQNQEQTNPLQAPGAVGAPPQPMVSSSSPETPTPSPSQPMPTSANNGSYDSTVATPANKSKKNLVIIIATLLAVTILLITGAVLAAKSSSDSSAKSEETTTKNNESDSKTPTTNTEQGSDSAVAIGGRDTMRENDLSRISAIIVEYQINNNGKIPTDATSAQQALRSYQQDSIAMTDPLTKKEYVFISYAPPKGSTFEIQYAPQQTCSGEDLSPSTIRSFALRIYLESGKLICMSS